MGEFGAGVCVVGSCAYAVFGVEVGEGDSREESVYEGSYPGATVWQGLKMGKGKKEKKSTISQTNKNHLTPSSSHTPTSPLPHPILSLLPLPQPPTHPSPTR